MDIIEIEEQGKKINLILEIEKIVKDLCWEISQEKILKNLPEFNKISCILDTIGFDRLKITKLFFWK